MLIQVQKRLRNHTPRQMNAKLPRAAVLIPVTNESEPRIIFTRRADHMNTHSGEVAFPGGKQDDTDRDLIATALRESLEEIGLPEDHVRVIGQTGSIVSRYGIEVTPIVGIVDADTPLTPNADELDRIFRVPVSFFLDKTNLTFDHYPLQDVAYHMPCFQYQEYRIWGLTAVILAEFLNLTLDAEIPMNAPQFSANFMQLYRVT